MTRQTSRGHEPPNDSDLDPVADKGFEEALREIARMPEKEPPFEFAPGGRFGEGGRYMFERPLGRGGMGTVYLATDTTLHRQVALKILHPRRDPEDGSQRRRVLREARLAARLEHHRVARIYDVGEHDGAAFVSMEYVRGVTMRDWLRQRRPLEEVLTVAVGVAEGVAALHERGMVHRDLKPENVILTDVGGAKLLDFGLAQLTRHARAASEHETLSNAPADVAILGTPAYMSPEQLTRDPLDARTDVFSFGVMLYESLAGVRPFSGGSFKELAEAILSSRPPALESRNVPESVSHVVSRCLEKLPSSRYRDGGELVCALQDLSRPARGHTEREAPPSAPSSRRRRRALAVVLLVAGLGGVSAGVWRWSGGRSAVRGVGAELASLAPTATPAPNNDDGRSRSADPAAERLFEEGMRSFHDGTGQAIPLLKAAIATDPGFAGAYLRLWWLQTRLRISQAASEEAHRHLLALSSALSPRDAALFGALPDRAKLTVYLERYRDDDLAWVAWTLADDAVESDFLASLTDALAARPTLVPLLAIKANRQFALLQTADGEATVARCLEVSPSAVDCLQTRALDRDGRDDCRGAESDTRQVLTIDPRALGARTELAGLLLHRGAPKAAAADLLRSAADEPWGRDDAPWNASAILPYYEGDFDEVVRLARAELSHISPDADDVVHLGPFKTLVDAYTEAGDVKSAGRVASEYLDRSEAWPHPENMFRGFMIGAAIRGGQLGRDAGERKLEALYRVLVGRDRVPASDAWASVYAAAARTKAEAEFAVARLASLGVVYTPGHWPSAAFRVFALTGRPDVARPLMATYLKGCSTELSTTRAWVHSHLRAGELDARSGDTTSACAHFAKVIDRWGMATPRSAAVDEAMTLSQSTGCPARR